MDDMTRMRSVIVDLFLGSGRSTRRYEKALCTKYAAGWRVLLITMACMSGWECNASGKSIP
jgi:hypothetical protein